MDSRSIQIWTGPAMIFGKPPPQTKCPFTNSVNYIVRSESFKRENSWNSVFQEPISELNESGEPFQWPAGYKLRLPMT